eukprot:SAG22_NODE_827_length_6957_cov_4.434821_3_plen_98_part_00
MLREGWVTTPQIPTTQPRPAPPQRKLALQPGKPRRLLPASVLRQLPVQRAPIEATERSSLDVQQVARPEQVVGALQDRCVVLRRRLDDQRRWRRFFY